ncbi:MAG TPA: transcriptional repressor TraM [Hyphomicrobium zavarzinii]|nr:transcriptional repressor TraM [Hyphomicrobium zavarzinii]
MQTVVRPIVGLTSCLPKSVLESIVVEAILKHRFLLDLAEVRQAEAGRCDESLGSVSPAGAAYVRAMIDVHAQQTILSTLIDVLGYVPAVPAD